MVSRNYVLEKVFALGWVYLLGLQKRGSEMCADTTVEGLFVEIRASLGQLMLKMAALQLTQAVS